MLRRRESAQHVLRREGGGARDSRSRPVHPYVRLVRRAPRRVRSRGRAPHARGRTRGQVPRRHPRCGAAADRRPAARARGAARSRDASVTVPGTGRGSNGEAALVAALRAGDERAFMQLVEEYTPGMRRLALGFVRTPALADDVVQEAWLGVLKGLDRFEGRSSLKTWVYTIVANVARTRAVREARSVPFSSLAPADPDDDGAAVDPDRFVDAGHWVRPIEPWRRVVDAEARGVIDAAIARLP